MSRVTRDLKKSGFLIASRPLLPCIFCLNGKLPKISLRTSAVKPRRIPLIKGLNLLTWDKPISPALNKGVDVQRCKFGFGVLERAVWYATNLLYLQTCSIADFLTINRVRKS